MLKIERKKFVKILAAHGNRTLRQFAEGRLGFLNSRMEYLTKKADTPLVFDDPDEVTVAPGQLNEPESPKLGEVSSPSNKCCNNISALRNSLPSNFSLTGFC